MYPRVSGVRVCWMQNLGVADYECMRTSQGVLGHPGTLLDWEVYCATGHAGMSVLVL